MSNEPPIEIPALLPGKWLAVVIERFELAGSTLSSVTIRRGCGRAPRRRWFPDRAVAVAHALELAEEFDLPLLDLGEGGGEA